MFWGNTFVECNRKIYSALQDKMSRYIFAQRQLYSLTGDMTYIYDMIKKTVPEFQVLRNLSEGIPFDSKCYLFGAGNYAGRVKHFIHVDWKGIADNDANLWGTERYALPVISPKAIPKDARIYIANNHHWKDIYDQLRGLDFPDCQIVSDVSRILTSLGERIYFDLPALSLHEHEIFIDGGAYDGFSSKMFTKWSSGKFDCIYAFEPDKNNRDVLLKNFTNWNIHERIKILPCGLWNKTGTLSFDATGGQGSSIKKEGNQQVKVLALDEQPYANEISFIKMDIEGAEHKALKGAEGIIRKNHPKLAISIYHKPEDIFVLPALLLSYYPQYKFYLRHYTFSHEDTVLYAV